MRERRTKTEFFVVARTRRKKRKSERTKEREKSDRPWLLQSRCEPRCQVSFVYHHSSPAWPLLSGKKSRPNFSPQSGRFRSSSRAKRLSFSRRRRSSVTGFWSHGPPVAFPSAVSHSRLPVHRSRDKRRSESLKDWRNARVSLRARPFGVAVEQAESTQPSITR